jgi:hypothetical protein
MSEILERYSVDFQRECLDELITKTEKDLVKLGFMERQATRKYLKNPAGAQELSMVQAQMKAMDNTLTMFKEFKNDLTV